MDRSSFQSDFRISYDTAKKKCDKRLQVILFLILVISFDQCQIKNFVMNGLTVL